MINTANDNTANGNTKNANACQAVAGTPLGGRYMRTLIGILFLLSVSWGMAQVTNTNDAGAGSLREAIANAASGDIITFAAGLAGQTITLSSTLTINQTDLIIDASALGTGNKITVERDTGAGNFRVFTHTATGTFTINNLIVQNGRENSGGGIYSPGDVVVIASQISNNSDATSDNGGGIFSIGNVTVTNSTISDNTATLAGGGVLAFGNVEVVSSTISNNEATTNFGGGVRGDTVTVTDSVIIGNSAGSSGGISSASDIAITNSLIAGNSGGSTGGGVTLNSGTLEVINSTITGNTADNGGGVFIQGTANITNSLILGNTSNNLNTAPAALTNSAYGFAAGQSTNDSFVGFVITDVFTNPEPAANAPTNAGDYTLAACSPAINVGDNASAPAGNDLAGNARIQQTVVDMGAYESALQACQTITFDLSTLPAKAVGDANFGISASASSGLAVTFDSATPAVCTVAGTSANNADVTLLTAGTCTINADQAGDAQYQAAAQVQQSFTVNAAATDVVNKLADTNDGSCDTTDCSLREAIANAAEGDTITFSVSGTISLGSQLNVTQNDLTVDASGQTIVISGQNSHRVFSYTGSGTFEIINLIVQEGNSGIDAGAGIFSNSALIVTNSEIINNTSTTQGGGIQSSGTVTLNNSLVANNNANIAGGGVGSAGDVILNNSTVVGNSAGNSGGIGSGGTVTLNNSLVLGNTPNNVASPTLNNSAHGFATGESTGNSFVGFTLAQVFTDPTAGNYTLIACSPAINAGDNASAPAGNDLAGNARIQQTVVDMGAYESAFTLAACATPTTIVNKLADTNDGSCDTVDCSLREAIAAAAGGDTITFDGSLSGGTITLALGQLSTGLADLTIDASALVNPITIDAAGNSRVFRHTGTGTFEIINLVVTNGDAGTDGGGIFSNGNGDVTVTNSTISGNSAGGLGGGILSSGNVTVTNSTISGNSAGFGGGGIYSFDNVTVTNSTISGNDAALGGGIYSGDNVTVTNSTISGNLAGDDGGGIYSSVTVTLTNSTISGNAANSDGGGIFSNNVTVNNSLVLGNDAPINPQITGTVTLNINSSAYGFATGESTGDSFVGFALADVFTTPEPAANAPTAAGNYTLIACSPAINAGDNASAPAGNDLAGNARIQQTVVDMGAYESAFTLAACATPTTIVNKLADTNDGSCDTTDCSLREAIANAASGDTITFDASLLGGTITLTSGELSTALADLIIDASTLADLTIDAANNSRVFRHTGTGTFEIINLVVTNGNTGDFGGGISSNGDVTVTNSTISGNSANYDGGGIYSFGTVTVTNSTISGNSADFGGGGIVSDGDVTVNNSAISGNSANYDGGGIYSLGTVTVTNSTISGNSADTAAGGIFSNGNGTVTVTNSTISGNSAYSVSGGIYSIGTVTLNNSTISGNSANNEGGGIYSFVTVTLNNSLVLGNTAPTNPQIRGTVTLNSSAYGFATGESTGNRFVGFALADVFTTPEPAANAPTTAGNYTLIACSPAINAGNNASAPAGNDLAGNARIQVVTVDMGAYESALQACQTITFDLSALPAKTYGDADFAISASASSGLAVTFDSATPAVCTVAGTSANNADVTILTAGTCTVEADQTGNAEYQAAAQVTQDIIIAKKALDATVNNQTRDYGAANSAFTLTYTGLVPGDTAADIDTGPALNSVATATSDAGTYPITCDTAPFIDNNYTLNSCTPGTLTVGQVDVTVTANDVTITEGDTPTFTATYGGFVAPDDESVLDTAVSFADGGCDYNTAGTCTITPSGAVDVNYTFSYNPGTLTIQSAGFNITESGGNTAVTEGAGADTIDVVLTSVPTANVVITVTPDGQLDVGAGASTAFDLTFTAANWNIPQTLNVTAVDDTDIEGNHNGTLSFAVTSADTNYDGATLADITVAITDNDAGVIITPTNLTTAEGAAATSYDIAFNTNPASDVIITITPDAQTDVGAGAGTATTLTFTIANATTAQTVNVTAVDDTDIEGAHTSTISHAITTGDAGDYPTTFVIDDVTVAITDNDAANTGGSSVINPNQDMQIRNGSTTAAATITSNTIEPLRYGTFKRGQAVTLDFLIRNPGAQVLELGELTLPSFFSNVGEPLPATLASFASALLTVEVDTSTAGTFTGQVSLASNDPDANENPFVFDVIVTVSNTPANAINVLPGIDLGVGNISAGQQNVVLLSFKVEVPAGSVPVDLEGIVLASNSIASVEQASNLRLYIDGGTRGELDNRDVFVAELAGSDVNTLTFTFPTRTFQPALPMWFIVVGDF